MQVVQAFDDVARGVLAGLAASLHMPPNTFQPVLDTAAVHSNKQSASSLEAIHYMLLESQAATSSAPEACQAHEDKGLLTLIYSDTEQGLWVRPCIVAVSNLQGSTRVERDQVPAEQTQLLLAIGGHIDNLQPFLSLNALHLMTCLCKH